MRVSLLITVILIVCGNLYSQILDLASENTISEPRDSTFYTSIIDETYGITLYEKLNYMLGGDSVRHDNKGYAARGWIEDHYPNGQILHKGYYIDGQLKIYKNYYPSGQLERSYRTLDNYRSELETYYPDGVLKSKVLYKEGYPLTWEDYYPTGKLEYKEEFDNSLDYYIMKKSYYPNGQLESLLELVNKKKMIYNSEEYTVAGILKERGEIFFNAKIFDYQKIGKWSVYDESGKLTKEETYVDGKLTKEKEM